MMTPEDSKTSPWYAVVVSRIAVDVPLLLLAGYGFYLQSTMLVNQMEGIIDKLERLTVVLEQLRYPPVTAR